MPHAISTSWLHSHWWLRGICALCRVPLFKSETRGIFLHSVEPPIDHDSLLAVVEPGTLVIFPTAACQVEIFLAACSIPQPRVLLLSPGVHHARAHWCPASHRVQQSWWLHEPCYHAASMRDSQWAPVSDGPHTRPCPCEAVVLLQESQARRGSGSTIVLHDDGGRRGPGHPCPPAFPHWLRLWKPPLVVSCYHAHA